MSWGKNRRQPTGNYVPKVRRKRPSVWKNTIWPAMRACVLAALFVTVLIVVANKVLRPIQRLHEELRQTELIRTELKQLKRDNAILQRKIRHLQTPEGWTQAARQYGLVKPGEITLIMGERDIAMANSEDLPTRPMHKSRQQ